MVNEASFLLLTPFLTRHSNTLVRLSNTHPQNHFLAYYQSILVFIWEVFFRVSRSTSVAPKIFGKMPIS
jgi:hypothetical protein